MKTTRSKKRRNTSSERVTYEIDHENRLVAVTSAGRGIPRTRRVIEGRFAADRDSGLVYQVKTPAGGTQAPHHIRVRGTWSLTRDNTVTFTLEKNARSGRAGTTTLTGSIIDARGNALLAAVTARSGYATLTTYALEIAGIWQMDAQNRLTFRAAKGRTSAGVLIFEGTWEYRDAKLVYTYESRKGSRKQSVKNALMFHGHWHLTDAHTLTYSLDAADNATFRFQASIISASANGITFELGSGCIQRARPRIGTIVMFGRWRIRNGGGLTFEVENARTGVYSIAFTAEAHLTGRDTISFTLKSGPGTRNLGIRVEIARSGICGDGEAFVRFLRDRRETAVLIGAAWGW